MSLRRLRSLIALADSAAGTNEGAVAQARAVALARKLGTTLDAVRSEAPANPVSDDD
jgi:hypothetical protein